MSRPDLPRASSAMSGFFFCGMIDEPGGIRVVERDEAELPRVPDDDVLGEAGEVDAELRGDEGELGHDIAARSRVDRVLGRARQPQFFRDERGSRPSGSPGQRAGAGRARRWARTASRAAARGRGRAARRGRAGGGRAAPAGRAAGGCARHRGAEVRLRLRGDRVDEVDHVVGDRPGVVEQVQPDEGGDLVVAAAAGAQLAAELRAPRSR